MKYIIFHIDSDPPRKVPIIFPSNLVHKQVAQASSKLVDSSKIYSAGELVCRVKNVQGHSSTIGIKSKLNDTEIINNYDYQFGLDVEQTSEIEKVLEELTKQILEDK